jgi:dTDP-4-amino-4,6-dideoxygalactose transaminase
LPNAHKAAEQVLCLPIYPDLPLEDVARICVIIDEASRG